MGHHRLSESRGLQSVAVAAKVASMKPWMWVRLMLGAVLGLSLTGMAPEPDPVPRRWQLDVEVGPLRMAVVESEGPTQAYFYMTYKVTNASGGDLLLAPALELATRPTSR